eukprot:s3521_g13.t1
MSGPSDVNDAENDCGADAVDDDDGCGDGDDCDDVHGWRRASMNSRNPCTAFCEQLFAQALWAAHPNQARKNLKSRFRQQSRFLRSKPHVKV